MNKAQKPANLFYLHIGVISIFMALLTAFFFPITSACLADNATAKGTIEASKLPRLVFINSRECPVCSKVRPIVSELTKEYKSKIDFVDLDVTDDKATQKSKQTAKRLQLSSFFALYQDTFPCVGIFDTKGKCVRELFGANPKKTYATYLEKVTSQSH